jgi:protease I
MMKKNFFLFLFLFLCFVFSTVRASSICLIIAHRNFNDTEYRVTREELERSGYEIKVASLRKDSPAEGMEGLEVLPDLTLEEVVVADYQAIVFIGGSGTTVYFSNSSAHSICRQAVERGKVLAAICIAPVILANAGVLNGKRATVFPGYEALLESRGAIYVNQPVVTDGLLVTANGPSASLPFAREITQRIVTSVEKMPWGWIKLMFR